MKTNEMKTEKWPFSASGSTGASPGVGNSHGAGASPKSPYVILSLGAFWGLAEATLGFGLHLLPRFLAIPNLAGAIMFPIALFFMVQAIKKTGHPGAAMGTAMVAAAIKGASLVLPVVQFAFVRSPILAILSEGAIVTAAGGIGLVPFYNETSRREAPAHTGLILSKVLNVTATALLLSALWRVLFLGLNVVLGITGGILAKPTAVVLSFLTVDSLWNTALILGFYVSFMLSIGSVVQVRPVHRLFRRLHGGGLAGTMGLLIVALLAEFGTAALPL